MGPKTFQIECTDGSQSRPNGAQMAPRWSQNGEKTRKKSQRNKQVGGVPRRRPISTENRANMVPTWASKWSQDAQKIDPKIYHFFDASRDRFLD